MPLFLNVVNNICSSAWILTKFRSKRENTFCLCNLHELSQKKTWMGPSVFISPWTRCGRGRKCICRKTGLGQQASQLASFSVTCGSLLVFHFRRGEVAEMTFSHWHFCLMPDIRGIGSGCAALASSPGGCSFHGSQALPISLCKAGPSCSPHWLGGRTNPWLCPRYPKLECPRPTPPPLTIAWCNIQSLLASAFWDYMTFQLLGLLNDPRLTCWPPENGGQRMTLLVTAVEELASFSWQL